MSVKPETIVAANAQEMARTGARMVSRAAQEAVGDRDRFVMALSGGSTPRAMNRLLAKRSHRGKIPWQRTDLFMVDERMVDLTHPHSNFGNARNDLLDHLPISPNQLHPMPVTGSLEEGAAAYQRELETFFHQVGNGDPVFDLIILGIGDDGHTASLFPGQPMVVDPNRWVLGVTGGNPPVARLTLNFGLINRARNILFLASGKKKASVMRSVLQGRHTDLPAAKIAPPKGKVWWLLDREAASLLSRTFPRETP